MIEKISDYSKLIITGLLICIIFILLFGGLFLAIFIDDGFAKYSILLSSKNGYFKFYLSIYLLLVFLFGYIYFKFIRNCSKKTLLIYIFFLAFIPRIIICLQENYVPMSDFNNYFNFGLNFYYGNFSEIARIVSMYGLPSFGGLALFNGLIMKLFSPTLWGLQLGNCIMTSFICIVIFGILNIYNYKAALIGAFLYAVYPSNIVSSQVTTNHHGTTLFAYIAIYLFLRMIKSEENSNKKDIILSVIIGLFLTISNFFHPSAVIYVLAISFFSFLFYIKNNKLLKKYLLCVGSIIITFILASNVFIYALNNYGIISSTETAPILSKFVVGLNVENAGKYDSEIYSNFNSLNESEQLELTVDVVTDAVVHPVRTLKLFIEKGYIGWFSSDSYFYWAYGGKITQANEKGEDTTKLSNFNNSFGVIDILFLRIVYAVGLFYLITSIKDKSNDKIRTLLVWIILGWIGLYFLTEIQPRYRYMSIPSFVMLASFGFCEIINKINMLYYKYFEK